ncbi:MAG: hypothetical protein VR67_17375 [Peptococcaceae bacterium BRH_c8a]|nr:MAG: hypothetical protein VR67_17375 [Peptococcaceae bacterium BRH_c8a]
MKIIKNIRKKKGFTQKALALKAGISRSYLCEIEQGYKQPSLATLSKIAMALGVSEATLLIKKKEAV